MLIKVARIDFKRLAELERRGYRVMIAGGPARYTELSSGASRIVNAPKPILRLVK